MISITYVYVISMFHYHISQTSIVLNVLIHSLLNVFLCFFYYTRSQTMVIIAGITFLMSAMDLRSIKLWHYIKCIIRSHKLLSLGRIFDCAASWTRTMNMNHLKWNDRKEEIMWPWYIWTAISHTLFSWHMLTAQVTVQSHLFNLQLQFTWSHRWFFTFQQYMSHVSQLHMIVLWVFE